jgi:hypothetical protein
MEQVRRAATGPMAYDKCQGGATKGAETRLFIDMHVSDGVPLAIG